MARCHRRVRQGATLPTQRGAAVQLLCVDSAATSRLELFRRSLGHTKVVIRESRNQATQCAVACLAANRSAEQSLVERHSVGAAAVRSHTTRRSVQQRVARCSASPSRFVKERPHRIRLTARLQQRGTRSHDTARATQLLRKGREQSSSLPKLATTGRELGAEKEEPDVVAPRSQQEFRCTCSSTTARCKKRARLQQHDTWLGRVARCQLRHQLARCITAVGKK